MRRLYTILIFVVTVLLPPTVIAGPLEEGFAAYERQDYTEALKYWLPLAERGDVKAQFSVGTLYDNGQGVTQNYKKAAEWYKRAAHPGSGELGFAEAQYFLGLLYMEGRLIEGNADDIAIVLIHFENAAHYFEMAANQGHALAQFKIGRCYLKGIGVKANDKIALFWYEKAAEKGVPEAQYVLGMAYKNGGIMPVEINHQIARQWLEKAASAGIVQAKAELDELNP